MSSVSGRHGREERGDGYKQRNVSWLDMDRPSAKPKGLEKGFGVSLMG